MILGDVVIIKLADCPMSKIAILESAPSTDCPYWSFNFLHGIIDEIHESKVVSVTEPDWRVERNYLRIRGMETE